KPIAPLADKLRDFSTQHFNRPIIGAHLRRGDFFNTRPDVVANETVVMQAVDEWLNQEPSAGIFLCTDDGTLHHKQPSHTGEGIREHFVKRYGERVVYTTPRSLDRGVPEAIQDALVDLWLLRQTNYFVGTTGSSFSELAVFGRSVPSVLLGAPTPRYQRIDQW